MNDKLFWYYAKVTQIILLMVFMVWKWVKKWLRSYFSVVVKNVSFKEKFIEKAKCEIPLAPVSLDAFVIHSARVCGWQILESKQFIY